MANDPPEPSREQIEGFRHTAHDETVRRRILAAELAAFLVEYFIRLKSDPYITVEGLKQEEQRIQMDVLKYARNVHGWTLRELPLIVKLDFIRGKLDVDFHGIMAYEVALAVQEYLQLGTYYPPPGSLDAEDLDDPYEDDDEVESGFVYGR
jgi:hypothetical protein